MHRAGYIPQSSDQLVSPLLSATTTYSTLPNSRNFSDTELPLPAIDTKFCVQDLLSQSTLHQIKTEILTEVKEEHHADDDTSAWPLTESGTQNLSWPSRANVHPSSLVKLEFTSYFPSTSGTESVAQDPLHLVHPLDDTPTPNNWPFLEAKKLPKVTIVDGRVSQSTNTRNSSNCISKSGKETKDSSGQTQHICEVPNCAEVHKSKYYLKQHEKRHNDEKNFICDYCDKDFGLKDKLRNHIKSHLFLKTNQRLDRRERTKCPCLNCLAPDRNKVKHSNGTPQHPCPRPDCGQVFDRPSRLKYHLDRQDNKINFVCELCNKGFVRKDSYNLHIRIPAKCKRPINENKRVERPRLYLPASSGNKTNYSNGTPQRVCPRPDCGRVFKQPSHLKYHLDIHDGKINFVCELCNKGFVRKDKYNNHVRTHNGEKNFHCHYCNKDFSSRDALNRHIRNLHESSKNVKSKVAKK